MKRKIQFFATVHFLFFIEVAFSQITFQKTYGGTNDEAIYSMQQTFDGGYVMVGQIGNIGAGNDDVYLIRTDSIGDTMWTKTFGNAGEDIGTSVQQTKDGGFIIAGTTGNDSASDIYLLRTDTSGNLIWAKAYGGNEYDAGNSVQQTSDEGFIIVGITFSFGAGGYDVYLIKTDAQGDTLWTKTYGGLDNELGRYTVKQTNDSGFIISGGWTESFGAGNDDGYLIRINAEGDVLWTKTYGGMGQDHIQSVLQTVDGGFILAGNTSSFGAGYYDIFLTKTDAQGNAIWTKTFGAGGFEGGGYVRQTVDGGFIITGAYNPVGSQYWDVYLIRTDNNGNLIWTKTYGGTDSDLGNDVQQTDDGGYTIAAYTRSFGAGGTDVYLIRTDSMGNSGCNQTNYTTITNTGFMQVGNPASMVSSGGTINTPVVISGSGCTITTLCTTVGINEVTIGNSFLIYPNPSRNSLNIQNNSSQIIQFTLYNSLGEIIISKSLTNKTNRIDLSAYSNGIYFYKLTSDKSLIKTGKIIKQ